MAGSDVPRAASSYRERNSTADRALDILNMFSDERESVAAADVSRQLDVARSTAYRYLQSLVRTGFLEDSNGSGFRLGRRILELAMIARKGLGLSEIARPVMHRLSAEAGEAVLLTRLAGEVVICLEREEVAAQPVRISYERGQVLPTNAGAPAYVLLAWMSDQELDRILGGGSFQRFTPATLTTEHALRRRLKETREHGYAVSRAELDDGVLGIAAPIRAGNGQVVAAVSVAAVSARLPDHRVPAVADAVRAAASEISASLSLLD